MFQGDYLSASALAEVQHFVPFSSVRPSVHTHANTKCGRVRIMDPLTVLALIGVMKLHYRQSCLKFKFRVGLPERILITIHHRNYHRSCAHWHRPSQA